MHSLTEAEHITRAGAGMGSIDCPPHSKWWTKSKIHPRQEQKERGPRQELEHRSKGSIQQMVYLQYKSEVHQQAEVETGTPMA